MKLSALRSALSSSYHNSKGWKTGRKIVVIESDDWGTIRMPSKMAYEALLKNGIKVDKCAFNRNDSLATSEDLQLLFEVLTGIRDSKGNSPKITANTIVANPDFDKIRGSGFQEYQYELFTDTLKKYENRADTFAKWKEGINANIFIPQFHGREHVNITRWLKYLRSNSYETRLAFDLGLFGLSTEITLEKRRSYMAALDYETDNELELNKVILRDGLKLFNEIFGFRATSFIAPNYVWSDQLNKTLVENGISYLQSGSYQILPLAEQKNNKAIRRYMGQSNEEGQIYTIRNCTFEPAVAPENSVTQCLSQIKSAFFWKKPAIISSHRLNFVGSINIGNRDKNLILFKELLTEIIKKWPDIEFMSSDQLGDLIIQNK